MTTKSVLERVEKFLIPIIEIPQLLTNPSRTVSVLLSICNDDVRRHTTNYYTGLRVYIEVSEMMSVNEYCEKVHESGNMQQRLLDKG